MLRWFINNAHNVYLMILGCCIGWFGGHYLTVLLIHLYEAGTFDFLVLLLATPVSETPVFLIIALILVVGTIRGK